MRRPPNVFAGLSLDRAAHLRRDPVWLAARLADPGSWLIPFWRGRSLVRWKGERAGAVRLAVGETLEAAEVVAAGTVVLLGVEEERAHFALDLSQWDEAEARGRLGGAGELVDLKTVGSVLPGEEAALLAYVRGLLHWHSRHGFCGVCGAPTESRDGGHLRRCTGCGTDHFPRTDAAVIMLVTDGERCLLGHQAAWPERVYSTLAGFLEPGESLEEAVAREVWEEAGIRVADVAYHSSQPWPFPASIMLGFTARALTTDIERHDDELADARWFHRRELADRATRPIQLPSRHSIAYRLIKDWLAGEA
ncbi:MAG TPA: NAD(+) diphosphatase [Thermoanaerobaculia bacterium]|nr:NAD(+) diphosphatase [Thermoanaerobaculia bacterium]